MTGRKAGKCTGNKLAGFNNPGRLHRNLRTIDDTTSSENRQNFRRGGGKGQGFNFRKGFGIGFRRRFYQHLTTADENTVLKAEIQTLKDRIRKLEKNS